MALRAPALFMGTPAVNHTAQNDRLGLLGLFARPEVGATATNRPLAGEGGRVTGPPGTMGEVTLLSNTQFTVNPARWLLQSSASALGGMYEAINDAVETLNITAQHATQYRKSYFGVWVSDLFVAGVGDDLPHWGLQDGPLAASAPALPLDATLPANFLKLGEFFIPPVGQAVTYTSYDVRIGVRGGILPTTTTDTRLPAFDGQARWHPTFGLQIGKGGAWIVDSGSPQPVRLALSGTWQHWADSHPSPVYERLHYVVQGTEVKIRGLIGSSAAVGAGTTIVAALPAAILPPSRVVRSAFLSAGSVRARLDVIPAGDATGGGPSVLAFETAPAITTTDYIAIDLSYSLLNNV